MTTKGKLIVIDGTDGSGKATQTNLLIERMKREKLPVETMSFPRYGTSFCVPIEAYLHGELGPADQINAQTASLFYAIDRCAAKGTLDTWLASGVNVVLDRYVTSNMGHQGGKIKSFEKRAEFFRWDDELEFVRLGLPRPVLNVILHVPTATTLQLVDGRGNKKDMHESDPDHLLAAERTYLEIAEMFEGFSLIECVENGQLLTVEQVHELVWLAVQPVLVGQTAATVTT